MRVPFLEVGSTYLELKEELDEAYRKVMESGRYILGEECSKFEKEFSDYCGVGNCVGVGNGLDALSLILRGYEIGEGDEVIVPSNTYIATWLSVTETGARPVPVEPDDRTYNIDSRRIRKAVTEKTKAIIAVHLYGQPCDMDRLTSAVQDVDVKIIEDSAQAHGASYKGRRTGSLGDAAAFSFYPTKNLGTYGDGGAVLTDDDDLAERVRCLRNYGSKEKYHNVFKGINSRLDELHASFLRVRLRSLDAWNLRRSEIAERYMDEIADESSVVLPFAIEEVESAWHQFVIRHDKRDHLKDYLQSAGVGTMIHYPIPPHESDAYRDDGWSAFDLSIAEELSKTVLSLPIGPHLKTGEQDCVISEVKRCLSRL